MRGNAPRNPASWTPRTVKASNTRASKLTNTRVTIRDAGMDTLVEDEMLKTHHDGMDPKPEKTGPVAKKTVHRDTTFVTLW